MNGINAIGLCVLSKIFMMQCGSFCGTFPFNNNDKLEWVAITNWI